MRKTIAVCSLLLASASTVFAQYPGWPRQLTKDGNTLVYYQPQVDNWSNFRQLDWHMAISLTPATGQPIVGGVAMHGWTSVNTETQMVLTSKLTVKNTYFPSQDPASAAQMDQLAKTFMPSINRLDFHASLGGLRPKT